MLNEQYLTVFSLLPTKVRWYNNVVAIFVTFILSPVYSVPTKKNCITLLCLLLKVNFVFYKWALFNLIVLRTEERMEMTQLGNLRWGEERHLHWMAPVIDQTKYRWKLCCCVVSRLCLRSTKLELWKGQPQIIYIQFECVISLLRHLRTKCDS